MAVARYGIVIGYDDYKLQQFDHDLGTFVRAYCSQRADWSPVNSNFNVTTGLPESFALGATEVSNPCSITGGPSLFYLLDPYACRVLAFEPATGSVYATFGGRRGIGTGRINPDALRRSIVAVANGKVFVTDNDDGTGGSGTGFVVQFDFAGAFEAEYSIATWITDLTALATFDQVTGWAYDTARGTYWALAQGSTSTYLFEVTTAGVVTGNVLDLTTRLLASLSVTLGGHNNSPADRVLVRGLHYHNGYLYVWADDKVIRVDLTSTSGDQLIANPANDIGPGSLEGDGSELTYVLRDQATGTDVVRVVTLATLAFRDYAPAVNPPTGVDGEVGGAWDAAVVPTTEDPSTQTSRELSMRARISVTAQGTMQMRAAISGSVTQTMTMRARILSLGIGQQVPLQMRARIEEPTTLADAIARSWEVTDGVGEYSRGFQLQATDRAGFEPGDTFTVYAGYDQTRVRLGQFEIDEVSQQIEPESELWEFTCRDEGSKELDSKLVTKTFVIQFPTTDEDVPSVSSADILVQAAAAAGVALGGSELPEYPLYANFVAQQESFIQIAQKLIEPWNLFPSSQYYIQVREGEIFILHRDWKVPPEDGYPIYRKHLKSLSRKQQRYLQAPNLGAFDEFVVKGTTVTLNILNQLGPQVRVEYARQLAEGAVTGQNSGSVGSTAYAQEWVLTETVNTEELWGDKVLTRIEEVYTTHIQDGIAGPTLLSARSEETHLYYEPSGPLGLQAIQTASAGPSPLALLYQTNTVRAGLNQDSNLFEDLFRTQTNYYYDESNRLQAEVQSTTRYNSNSARWELQDVATRFHSKTSGGTVRVGRIGLVADEGNIFLDSADAQQVGGSRVDFASTGYSVVSFQAIAPEPQVVVIGPNETAVIDPPARTIWSYENQYLGQAECEAIRQRALGEQVIQVTHHWDIIDFVSVLNPNLYSGRPLSVEVADGEFVDVVAETVTHSFSPEEALTRVTCKRLTDDPFP